MRRRHRDGAGWGKNSHRKHWLIRVVAAAQVAVFNRTCTGRGVIIDMHAGDGHGVEKDQADFFDPATSEATPAIALKLASQCRVRPDVYLCESRLDRRQALRAVIGGAARILPANRQLLRVFIYRDCFVN